jgi:hypothetical protein
MLLEIKKKHYNLQHNKIDRYTAFQYVKHVVLTVISVIGQCICSAWPIKYLRVEKKLTLDLVVR